MSLPALPSVARDPSRSIAVKIQGKAEFDVIHRRAFSNATGELLGGLLGAGTDSRPGTADVQMVLYPSKFGFRVVDTTRRTMASFIEFGAAYPTKPISGKSRHVKEPFCITDKSQVSYDQLIADPADINPRVESVLSMAARRLTNEIVYNIR